MISRIKSLLKKNMYLYYLNLLLRDRDFTRNYLNYWFHRNTSLQKDRIQVNAEVKLIRKYWNCPPYHYYRYKLYNRRLTDEQLLDYVPAFYFYHVHLDSVYKDIDLTPIEDKIQAHWLFISKGIPTPKMICYVRNNKILNPENLPITLAHMISLLKESKADKFFFKPATGKGGNGIFLISKIRNELHLKGYPNISKYLRKKFRQTDYIIQEGINQRSDFNFLNPSSVNTLRIITQIVNNVPQIAISIIRIGRKHMNIDNSSKGGISVEIDCATGNLSKYGYTERNMQIFNKHPDTGVVFEGFNLREWKEIKEKIYVYAKRMSHFRELAWDISICENEVTVVEVNSYYGIDHIQCCTGGAAKKLNLID